MKLKKIINAILQPQILTLWHDSSPGVRVKVKRTIIGRFFKDPNFATYNESSLSYKQQIYYVDYEKIINNILKNKEILPVLIGIDNDLDKLITEKLT